MRVPRVRGEKQILILDTDEERRELYRNFLDERCTFDLFETPCDILETLRSKRRNVSLVVAEDRFPEGWSRYTFLGGLFRAGYKRRVVLIGERKPEHLPERVFYLQMPFHIQDLERIIDSLPIQYHVRMTA